MAVILVQSVGSQQKSALPVTLESLGDPCVARVEALKEHVSRHTRISKVKQRMEYKGRVLKDDMTIKDAGLSQGGRIFMEALCTGGPGWFWH
ncbi:unnamed protein product [Effrenium voratum]|nr:unnamed protein product [Effrenium voratum]